MDLKEFRSVPAIGAGDVRFPCGRARKVERWPCKSGKRFDASISARCDFPEGASVTDRQPVQPFVRLAGQDPVAIPLDFGDVLRRLRRAAGFSQEALAERA